MAITRRPIEYPILIADENERDRQQLARLFESVGYRTVEAANGRDALSKGLEEPPGAVVLDVSLSDVSGYEVCRSLRERYGGRLPIVLVSANRTESYDRVAGLLIGADDYLVKPLAADELLIRVRRLIGRAAASELRATPRGASALTRREREVLGLLAEGLSQGEIASRLFITSRTVGTHIEHILRKLGVRNRTQAVARAYTDDLLGSPGSVGQ